MRKFGLVVEFALVVTLSATLTVHTVAAPGSEPEPQAPVPSIEEIEAAVQAADAQAIAINGGRLRPR